MIKKYFYPASLVLLLTLMLQSCFNSTDKPVGENGLFKNTNPSTNFSIKQIKLPYSDCNSPIINGNNLYICVNDKSQGLANKIISYNLKNIEVSSIYESKYEIPSLSNLKFNNNWLVWVDSNAFGNHSSICCKNISTGEMKIVYIYADNEGKATIISPCLYNNYVAWVEINNEIPTISLYNLNTGNKKSIAKLNVCSFYNSFVNMNDNTLLWTDCIDNRGVYCLYNLESNQITTIDAPYKYPGYAMLAKNKIYSINFNDYTNWMAQNFGVYDISSKNYKQLSKNYINMFRISDKYVGIMDAHNQFILYEDHNLLNSVNIDLPVKNIDSISFNYDGTLILTQDTRPETKILLISNR